MFIMDDIVATLLDEHGLDPIIFEKPKYSTYNMLHPRKELIWHQFAVYVLILGRQKRPLENTNNKRPLLTAINLVREVLDKKNRKETFPQSLSLTRDNHISFSANYSELNSANFVSLVFQLGQFVAGDEKLFHFTGKSGNVRLVRNTS